MIINLYRLFNILSLDVAAGAVICALFFSRLFEVDILPFGLTALALTVWIIYTADHLRDARTIAGEASSERHRFHQAHFKILLVAICIAIATDVTVIFFMRKPVLVWGFILALIVLIYLILQRYLKVLKEFFVACLYTCGVLLPSVSVATLTVNYNYRLIIVQFLMIAFTNLLMFSWFEKEEDRADQQHSFVTIYGKSFTAGCIYVSGAINLAITAFLLLAGFEYKPVLVLGLMNATLLLIFLFPRAMSRNYTYRLLGDAVFLIPVFYLLWAN